MFALSLIFLGLGLVSLGWGVWPSPTDGVSFTIPAGVLPGAPAGVVYANQSEVTVNASWQTRIRTGETGTITVYFSEMGADSGEPADRPVQVVLVEPVVPSVALIPAGRSQANLAAGQDLTLSWDVSGEVPGDYEGKLVISFGFFDDTLGEMESVPVAVVDLAFSVVSFYGLDGRLALWFGLVGVALWGALFLAGRVAAEK